MVQLRNIKLSGC